MPEAPLHDGLSQPARAALTELLGRNDPAVVGVVLTGSAARGMATSRSDVDVIVIRDEPESALDVQRSAAIDEIPMTLSQLETVSPIGFEGSGYRWQFAWAEVLRDDTGGRVTAAVRRQATLSEDEQRWLLVDVSRLDGFINYAYRALKSHRDGRSWEARLDSAESVASLLDVVFAVDGRVRPYNKYLAWELEEHPLSAGEPSAESLTRCLAGLLDGSETAMRDAFALVERASLRYDQRTGTKSLTEIIECWGSDLALLRGDS